MKDTLPPEKKHKPFSFKFHYFMINQLKYMIHHPDDVRMILKTLKQICKGITAWLYPLYVT